MMKKDGNIQICIPLCFYILPFLIIFFLLIPTVTFADKYVKIYSSVDENKIGINQTLILSVTIETKNISKILKPSLPDIKPFSIIDKSSSTSTEISFINGKTSRVRKYQYQYTLKPEKIGKFIIGSISVNYKGHLYKTDPIEILVTKKNNNRNPGYITDEGIKINPDQLKKEIFLKNSLNKRNAYVGEQIYMQYDIFSTHDLERISIINVPNMEGFYKIDLVNHLKLKYNTIIKKDKVYKHSILKQIILFPLFPGRFNISPLQIKVTALIKSPEYPNFFALPYTLILSSPKLHIKIDPLPPYKGNEKFSGIVGSLDIKVAQYSNDIYRGQPSKFYIIVKSTGNLNNLKDFQFNSSQKNRIILSDLYQDKKSINNIYYFTKKFEYIVIPEETGNLTIKIGNIVYFDTIKNKYISKHIDTLYYNVKPVPLINNEKSKREKNDISSINKKLISKYKILLFLIIFFFIILIIILIYLLIRKKITHQKSIQKSIEELKQEDKSNEVSRNIKLLLAEAESKLLNNNLKEASSLIKKSLLFALSNKTGLPTAKITIKNISTSNLDYNLKESIIDTINLLNSIIYSQNIGNISEKKKILNDCFERVRNLLKRLDISNQQH